MRTNLTLGLGLAALILGGCEDHPRRVAHGAPEYLHEALSGDVPAQARLAECLAANGGCPDTPRDPAMACAWRGVTLASRSSALSLADSEAYRAACVNGGETFRQRAAIGRAQFTRRIYGREADNASAPPESGLLYPSVEAVRQRLNVELGLTNPARLPAFGAAEVLHDLPRLSWRSCSASVCLAAQSPRFGGGLYAYRVSVSGPPDSARPLAIRLAAAGLEAQGLAGDLSAAADGNPGLEAGGVCWAVGREPSGAAFAAARLGPC